MREGGEGGIEHAWNIDEVDSTQAQRKKKKKKEKTKHRWTRVPTLDKLINQIRKQTIDFNSKSSIFVFSFFSQIQMLCNIFFFFIFKRDKIKSFISSGLPIEICETVRRVNAFHCAVAPSSLVWGVAIRENMARYLNTSHRHLAEKKIKMYG